MRALMVETVLVFSAFVTLPGIIHALSGGIPSMTASATPTILVANNPPSKVPPVGIFGSAPRVLFDALGCLAGAYVYLSRYVRKKARKVASPEKAQVMIGAMVTSFAINPMVVLYYQQEPGWELCFFAGFIGSLVAWITVEMVDRMAGRKIAAYLDKIAPDVGSGIKPHTFEKTPDNPKGEL